MTGSTTCLRGGPGGRGRVPSQRRRRASFPRPDQVPGPRRGSGVREGSCGGGGESGYSRGVKNAGEGLAMTAGNAGNSEEWDRKGA